jgi:hypothetical protein
MVLNVKIMVFAPQMVNANVNLVITGIFVNILLDVLKMVIFHV